MLRKPGGKRMGVLDREVAHGTGASKGIGAGIAKDYASSARCGRQKCFHQRSSASFVDLWVIAKDLEGRYAPEGSA
jgi:NAD(P)-dependent dehydrogenase (short-subunit alcohol dehydrogenase family)